MENNKNHTVNISMDEYKEYLQLLEQNKSGKQILEEILESIKQAYRDPRHEDNKDIVADKSLMVLFKKVIENHGMRLDFSDDKIRIVYE